MVAVALKRKTKVKLEVVALILLFMLMQATIVYLDIIHITSFNGVISALQYGVCLMLVWVDGKKGMRVAMILMGIDIIILIRTMIMSRTLYPLPGLANMIFYIVTVVIIAGFMEKRNKENISDNLTNAYNRRGLYKEITNLVLDREQFHVVYFSVYNYKYINDNYGHVYGDELLKEITNRIQGKIKKDDVVARINGCDFVAIIKNELDVTGVANNLLNIIREKATLVVDQTSVECYPECYAGCTYYDGKSVVETETLIEWTDVAMCEALNNKMQGVNIFEMKMMDALNRQLESETLIKEGLKNNYFYMVYQPQFGAAAKDLRGFESLLRLKTPDGVMVSPAEFIPVAERSELILKIDDYVLRRVMKEFEPIVRTKPELIVSINVSAKNICGVDFVDKIKNLLDMYSFPAHNLEIEITEYCMIDSLEVTISNIKQLKALGVKVALDDFGTGYTSLSYVAKMPINLLKIDKSLIDDISINVKDKEFLQAVISMGHVMGCELISEGVEDEEQLAYLKANGCDYIQGFVWGRPLAYEDAKALALE